MFGLPEGVVACLFDLDGVLTDTARLHTTAWAEMFDGYLRERAARTGRAVRRRSTPPGTTRSTSTAGPARTGCARSWRAGPSTCPRGSPATSPTPRRSPAWATARTQLFLRSVHEGGVTVFEGSRRYVNAVSDAGLAVAVVSSSANTQEVLEVTGLDTYVHQRVDGVTIREEHLAGKPAPDSFLRGAERLGVAPGRAAVFEDAVSGVDRRPGGRLRDRRRCRPGRARGGAAPPRCRRRRRGPGRSCCEPPVISEEAFPVEPWHVRETRLDLELLAQSESLFALSNGHIGLRGNLDEGEPYGLPAPTWAPSTRRGRCRTPRRATATRRTARRWSTSPTAR